PVGADVESQKRTLAGSLEQDLSTIVSILDSTLYVSDSDQQTVIRIFRRWGTVPRVKGSRTYLDQLISRLIRRDKATRSYYDRIFERFDKRRSQEIKDLQGTYSSAFKKEEGVKQ